MRFQTGPRTSGRQPRQEEERLGALKLLKKNRFSKTGNKQNMVENHQDNERTCVSPSLLKALTLRTSLVLSFWDQVA